MLLGVGLALARLDFVGLVVDDDEFAVVAEDQVDAAGEVATLTVKVNGTSRR